MNESDKTTNAAPSVVDVLKHTKALGEASYALEELAERLDYWMKMGRKVSERAERIRTALVAEKERAESAERRNAVIVNKNSPCACVFNEADERVRRCAAHAEIEQKLVESAEAALKRKDGLLRRTVGHIGDEELAREVLRELDGKGE